MTGRKTITHSVLPRSPLSFDFLLAVCPAGLVVFRPLDCFDPLPELSARYHLPVVGLKMNHSSSSLLPFVVVCGWSAPSQSGPGAFLFFALSFALNFGLPECFLSLTVAFSPSNLFFEKKDTTHTHSDDDVSQNVSQCLSPAWPTGGLARTLGWWRRVRSRRMNLRVRPHHS